MGHVRSNQALSDASFSSEPKLRCEAGGCKVISFAQRSTQYELFHEGVKPITWDRNDNFEKKTLTRGNTILLPIGVFRHPSLLPDYIRLQYEYAILYYNDIIAWIFKILEKPIFLRILKANPMYDTYIYIWYGALHIKLYTS